MHALTSNLLFWPGSAFVGSAFGFTPIFPALFHVLSMHFLALFGSALGWTLFNLLLQSFAPASSLMEFDTLMSNIVSVCKNSKKIWRSRKFESKCLPILKVFVIVCGVQSPRWSNQPIQRKRRLFASFWSITHLFVSISSLTITIWIWRFPWLMHGGPACRYRCPKLFVSCAKLLAQKQWITMSTCLILSSGAFSSRRFSEA